MQPCLATMSMIYRLPDEMQYIYIYIYIYIGLGLGFAQIKFNNVD